MGFLFNLKKALGYEKEYEEPYPHEVHQSLKNSDMMLEEDFSLNEPQFSMEYINNKEVEAPTHWVYKNVANPIEMNYRNGSYTFNSIPELW